MKTDLILLHGALGSSETFSQIVPELEKYFRVHRINFSGHGGRNFEQAFGIPQFVAELNDYVSTKQLSHFSVLGYSMGGYVGLLYALENPGKVNRILTVGTKLHWTPEFAETQKKMLNPEKIMEKIPGYAAILDKNHQPQDWKILMNKTAGMMYDLGQNPLDLSLFQTLDCTVMIGLAEMDNLVTEEECLNLVSFLKKGGMSKIPDSKHPFEQVNAEALMQLIHSFFKEEN
ncbi:MAG: alpha/beta hydrolase [Bacteroidia bacterium]|nr:alpha/beta hydrolase [Bacteroidia bacterium]